MKIIAAIVQALGEVLVQVLVVMVAVITAMVVLGLLLFTGCNPGIVGPPAGEYVEIDLVDGSLMVATGECDTIDYRTLVSNANRALEEAADAWPAKRMAIDGLPVIGQLDPHANGRRVSGYYQSGGKYVVIRCGVERVIGHEMGHALCFQQRLPCACSDVGHTLGIDCRPL